MFVSQSLNWLGGLLIVHTADGDTMLTGPVQDQAALFGLLMKIRDLSLTLASVRLVQP